MDEKKFFGDLPQALVEEFLNKIKDIGNVLSQKFQDMTNLKKIIRQRLIDDKILRNKASLRYQSIPTCCAVDGAYAIERMLSNDIVAVTAVAIEGFTPPSENRYWEGPNYLSFVETVCHDVNSLPRGIMMAMELEIAVNAPHDIVMMDGSFTTPLIHMNQALNSTISYQHDNLSNYINDNFSKFFEGYYYLLTNSRTDKAWIYLPKYTTKRELKKMYPNIWPFEYDDRAVLTFIMEPGEFLGPIEIEPPKSEWHFSKTPGIDDKNKINKLYKALNAVEILYYKPNPNIPALRIELNRMTAINEDLIAKILQCIEYQCSCGGIMEPYPLYMADKMVKSIGLAMPAFRQAATLQIAHNYQGDLSDIFFGMHSYRTESGRN